MAAFKDSFDPKNDLIYGIGMWISRYIIYYETGKKYKAVEKIPEKELQMAHKKKEEEKYAINTWNMAITNAQYALLQNDTLQVTTSSSSTYLSSGTAKYFDQFKNSRYGVSVKGGQVDLQKLKKSNKNLSNSDRHAICAAAKDLAIRRSSKFGIQYTVATLNGKIHYILDDIQQNVVLEKSTIKNGSGYEKMPICSSELRFLFRNWGRLKTSNKVIFWKNYETAQPLWADRVWQADWACYALDRMWKYRRFLPDDRLLRFKSMKQSEFEQLLTNINKFKEGNPTRIRNAMTILKGRLGENVDTPAQVIALFHSLPPDKVNKEGSEVV